MPRVTKRRGTSLTKMSCYVNYDNNADAVELQSLRSSVRESRIIKYQTC